MGRIKQFRHPHSELFLWSILNNLPDMAFLFWTRGEEALAKALIASRLFQQMAKVGTSRHLLNDVVENLESNAKYSLLCFSNLALFLM